MEAEQEALLRRIRNVMPLLCRRAHLDVMYSGGIQTFVLRWQSWLPGFNSQYLATDVALFDALTALREASASHSRGKIWKLDWFVPRSGPPTFSYRHEGDPVDNLDDIREPGDQLPLFPFRHGLPRRLLAQLTPEEAYEVIDERAVFLEVNGQPMAAPLRELFAFSAFVGSVNNGGFDQWFDREPTAHMLGGGENALRAARAGAVRLKLHACVTAFDDGLAIFASRQPYVANVCAELGISPRPANAFRDNAQVAPLTRLVQRNSLAWNRAIGAYLLAHIDEFADR